MIILPTRKRLERRRDALYKRLRLHHTSIKEVEDIMRMIHIINMRLRTYYDGIQIYDNEEDTTEEEDIFTLPIEELQDMF